eukprot:TRINITY_DN6027_c0_g1_i4.p3 TRINITY_DN6027_c0_g1~~TRINITY_DN6027_c0_g1_i4.p3  ORF type:complete len:136 (-),score=12.76 TRINITY_DN6027_c0_g1_i4:200-607(-)
MDSACVVSEARPEDKVNIIRRTSYMKGRLTRDKVNDALDEFAAFAVQNQKLMAQLKSGSCRLSQQERKRATELSFNIASKYKGRFWFCEGDLKLGKHIKLDKTGKSILTMMRHLGRLQEVRVNIGGQQIAVYLIE